MTNASVKFLLQEVMKKKPDPGPEFVEESVPTEIPVPGVSVLTLKQKTLEDFKKERKQEAGMLSKFRNDMKFNPIYTKLSTEIKINLAKPSNPLNWNPGLALNSDLYCETVKFARLNQPELLALLLGSETDYGEPFTVDDVGRFGVMLSLFMANSQIVPNYCTSLMKIKTITCKTNGLNDVGLDLLSKSRLTQCSRSGYNMRDQYANFALEMYKKYGSLGAASATVDNLAISKNGILKHFTQGFFSFEHDDLASKHR